MFRLVVVIPTSINSHNHVRGHTTGRSSLPPGGSAGLPPQCTEKKKSGSTWSSAGVRYSAGIRLAHTGTTKLLLLDVRVLVRLTTCKKLTNILPNLFLRTLFPLKRRDTRSAGYTGGLVNTQAVSFPGGIGESIFQVRHGEV